jgi:hypothetical protein
MTSKARWMSHTTGGRSAGGTEAHPVTRVPGRNPPGVFIHELTAITDIAPKIPLTAIGTPDQKCAQPLSHRQPHR